MRRKILIINEDSLIFASIKDALKYFDYEILEARTHDEAFYLANHYQPCLIIVDAQMKDSFGANMIAELDFNKQTHQIPIIATTSSDDSSIREKSFLNGASNFFKRPFTKQNIIKKVHDTLDMINKFQDSYTEKFIKSIVKYENCEESAKKVANKAKVVCRKLNISSIDERDIIYSVKFLSISIKEKNSNRAVAFFKKMDFAKPILEIIDGSNKNSLSWQITFCIISHEMGIKQDTANVEVEKAVKEAYDNFEIIAETNDEKEYALDLIKNEIDRDLPLELIRNILTHHIVCHSGCYINAKKENKEFWLQFSPMHGKIIEKCCGIIKTEKSNLKIETKDNKNFYILNGKIISCR